MHCVILGPDRYLEMMMKKSEFRRLDASLNAYSDVLGKLLEAKRELWGRFIPLITEVIAQELKKLPEHEKQFGVPRSSILASASAQTMKYYERGWASDTLKPGRILEDGRIIFAIDEANRKAGVYSSRTLQVDPREHVPRSSTLEAALEWTVACEFAERVPPDHGELELHYILGKQKE